MDTRSTENDMNSTEMLSPEQFPIYASMDQKSKNGGDSSRKKHSAAKVVALVLCCTLAGGAAGATAAVTVTGIFRDDKSISEPVDRGRPEGNGQTDNNNQPAIQDSRRDGQAYKVAYDSNGEEMSASEIYSSNVNSTVGITTSINTNFFGYQTTSAASDSSSSSTCVSPAAAPGAHPAPESPRQTISASIPARISLFMPDPSIPAPAVQCAEKWCCPSVFRPPPPL